MIELNWNIFKAKFNDKENKTFESLAYQLFCHEFDKPNGIFRFKNQVGIETDPIKVDNDLIGFQAKFYGTKISENKDDIISSISKAKIKNTSLTKIIFYINQEFSESSKPNIKSPQYKIDIENTSKEIEVLVEWRVPSHIEKQLSLPENHYLADFFFKTEPGILEFLEAIKNHTTNILHPIQNNIEFGEWIIKIDRSELIKKLKEDSKKSQLIIISGEGGSGKTALIKELSEHVNYTPFYLFKAIEFDVQNISDFIRQYGNYTMSDFINAHNDEDEKIVVIDSAEKLSDLENQDAFKEFLSALLENSWKILFTTRLSYLDDLKFQIIEVYRLPFEHIGIDNLSEDELNELSKKYNFQIPVEVRIRDLIRNLFYLDEFLKNYESIKKESSYRLFKEILWKKKIQNSVTRNRLNIKREDCFLRIVDERCNGDSFYVPAKNCSDLALSKLEEDEIIKYDTHNGGYFITHDIYEEWGLNLLIERAYSSSENYYIFFSKIGTSLAVRRAFRKWISDKILDNILDVRAYTEEAIFDDKLDAFWKDEILVSILLSDYASEFFKQFEEIVFQDNFQLLRKVIFLLRVACKQVDVEIHNLLYKQGESDVGFIYTKPKGSGWSCIIDLIYRGKDRFEIKDISFLIPLLKDWNSKSKKGNTTRNASLFALHFYQNIQDDKDSSNTDQKLIEIILLGGSKIKDELQSIFDQVIENKWRNHLDPYYELCASLLKSNDHSLGVLFTLPVYVLKLADLFWFEPERRTNQYGYDGIGTEKYYSLREVWHYDYRPASALKTPIYLLLQISLEEAINFILDFTNKTVESSFNSKFDEKIAEIEVRVDKDLKVKQYISNALWQLYRGTGSPVTPNLLQSIHMALEKRLLELAKNDEEGILEAQLIDLLKKSNSASISAVVTSVVLSHPEKYIKVALILFQTLDFLFYDNVRQMSEHHVRNLYSIGFGLNYKNRIYENERIKTCNDPHRNQSLESTILKYQFFGDKHTDESEFATRQQAIWEIIDFHQTELSKHSEETNENNKVKLLLARIDRRNMKPTVEQKEDKLQINFNPQIDPKLEQYRQDAISKSQGMMKYTALNLWAINKFDKNEKYGDYPQYDNNPKLVLDETKEIIDGLKNGDSGFVLFNSKIPAYTCSALVKEYEDHLSHEEMEFCKTIIKKYAVAPFEPNYSYQISDGVEVAISTLPTLIKLFPDEKEEFKIILLIILFDKNALGEYKRICDYSIEALLNKLWSDSFELAQEVFILYLRFKPVFNNELELIRHKNHGVLYSLSQLLSDFIDKYESELEEYDIKEFDLGDLDTNNYSIEDLEVAFQMIPLDTSNNIHLKFIGMILPVFSNKLLTNNRDEEINYSTRGKVFQKFAFFILNRELNEIDKFINPFVGDLSTTRESESFLQEIISAEDKLNKYDQFWKVWEGFYLKIVELSQVGGFHLNEVISSYLLAWPYWRENLKEWHSLKDREKVFYNKVVRDMGHISAVLDSISQLLNQIGSGFISDGVLWISNIIKNNKDLVTRKLEVNTEYYLEKLIRKYIYLNRSKVKSDNQLNKEVLIILNFLITRNSVSAYLLREDII